MRIKELELSSFRSFRGLTLPVDAQKVIIGGQNGSGKSSLREAIRWVLTGRCGVTDGRGVGADRLAPFGSDLVEASVTLHGIGKVSRRKQGESTSFTVEGLKGDASSQSMALFYKLQTVPEYLDAVLETEHFLRLDHVNAKALLLSLLDVKITVGETVYSLDELESAYAGAYEDRKLAKNRLKHLMVPAEPGEAFPPLEAIDGQLSRLRAELLDAAGTSGQIAGQRKAIEARIAAVRSLIKPVVSLAENVDQIIAKAEWDVKRLEGEMFDAHDVDIPAQTVAAKAPEKGSQERFIWLKQVIPSLEAHQPKKGCVLDNGTPCETHKLKFTSRIKTLKAELDALNSPAEDVPTPAVVAPNPLLELLRAAQKELADFQNAKSRHDAIVAHNATQEAQLASLQRELDSLPAGSEGDSGKVAELQARINKGEMMLRHARAYWQSKDAYDKASGEQKSLQADVERLEELVEALGPKGARVGALANALGAFEVAINSVTSLWGWKVSIGVDPWAVSVNGRRIETYSESEQFRMGIGIQLAVAQMSGLSFAIIDRIDMLDANNRRMVGEMLTEAPLEQIFMLSTREPNVPMPPSDESRIAYRFILDDGTTTVEAPVAA